MKSTRLAAALASLLLCSATAFAAPPASSASSGSASDSAQSPETLVQKLMKPMSSTTTGTVTVEGKSISYKAVAGTLVVEGTGSKESTRSEERRVGKEWRYRGAAYE